MFALARATTNNNTALAGGLVKSVSNCSIVSYSLLYIVSNFYQQLIDTCWSSFSESQRAVRFQCTMLNNPASLRSLIRH